MKKIINTALIINNIYILIIIMFLAPSAQGYAKRDPIICQGMVNFSLDENCQGEVNLSHVLVGGPYPQWASLILRLKDENGNIIPSNIVGRNHVGDTLTFEVYDPTVQNTCWGRILVEDKIPPRLICPANTTVTCQNGIPAPTVSGFPNGLTLGINLQWNALGHFVANAGTIDACSNTTLTYTDTEESFPCSDLLRWKVVSRVWTVRDIYGNIGTCTQFITLRKTTIGAINWPRNYNDVDLPALPCLGAWDSNGNGYPDINETGSPSNAGCNIQCSHVDQIINVCSGSYKVLRRWICLDWCTGISDTRIQIIKVEDKTPPNVLAPVDRTVSTDPNGCLANVVLMPAQITDACANIKRVAITGTNAAGLSLNFVLNQNGGFVFNIPMGTHSIRYEAEDSCGNIGFGIMNLTVIDRTAPVAICKSYLTIGLGQDGRGRINAIDFDNGSYDNCGIVRREVRRMSVACGQSAVFRDSVVFCCNDVNKKIPVILRVWDLAGNFNDCMDTVLVQDKLLPSLVCPPDISVDCRFLFDINNLSQFGTVVNGNLGEIQDSIVLSNGRFVGYDGVASDNCQYTLSTSTSTNIACGVGRIQRAFTATDQSGQARTCVQNINITDTDPFSLNDITWPSDYQTSTCGASLDTANIPFPYKKPRWREDICAVVGAGYEDWVFDLEAGCRKIIRRWKVIDWCRKNASGQHIIYTHDQIINVINSKKPVFDDCPRNLVFCPDNDGCDGFPLVLKTFATDDCTPKDQLRYTYSIDLFKDGTIDLNGASSDARGLYPLGTHKVTWRVEDGCGNQSFCEQFFTVRECKKPSPVCLVDVIFELMPTGMIQVCARSLVSKSTFDNCTPFEKLRFSFSADPNDSCRIFTCADLNWNILQVWVTDEAGNQDFCETVILIQDNMRMCPDASLVIKGNLQTSQLQPLDKATVQVSTDGRTFNAQTNSSGNFSQDSLFKNIPYAITPQKNDFHRNGVNTQDIIAIQKHILGVQNFVDPYQWIAADINKDHRVTASDLVELRKLILLKIDQFTRNTSWRFIDKKYRFLTTSPLLEDFKEKVDLQSETGVFTDVDFVAIKVGDVTGDARTQVDDGLIEERTTVDTSLWGIEERAMPGQNTEMRIPVYAPKMKSQGYQISLFYNSFIMSIKGIEAGKHLLSSENYSIDEKNGVVRVQYNQNELLNNTSDDPAFYLVVKNIVGVPSIKQHIWMAKDEMDNLFINESGVLLANQIEWQKAKEKDYPIPFILYQNQPNPWVSNTIIRFSLPYTMEAKLSIYDVTGKTIKTFENVFEAGPNKVMLKRDELPDSGVIYYQLEAGEFRDAKKMILLDK